MIFKRKSAFTLAEVLITLGIIGVVAAMTLPTLIQNKKHKELESAFKKGYSVLSQTTQRVFLEDYGGSEISQGGDNLDILMKNYQKYFIKCSTCSRTDTACDKSVFPMSRGSQLESFVSSNYKTFSGNNGSSYYNDGIIALTDGMFIFFDTDASIPNYYIAIDTNGWRKGPNKHGHDFFGFQLKENGRLLPMGAEGTDLKLCSTTSTSPLNGLGCTEKALSDKDYFKNLP